MIQVDSEMIHKVSRALKLGNDLYTIDEIMERMKSGDMQGHVEGDTWAITEVQKFPRHKVVHVLFVVGSLENSIKLEAKITEWAKHIGASLMTAVGRGGWQQFKTPGWSTVGTMYSKDLADERR